MLKLIPGIVVIGLTISTAALADKDRRSDGGIQKWVSTAEACLSRHGKQADGCYVAEGPRIYCPSMQQKSVADGCDTEADGSDKPKRWSAR